MEDSGNLWPKTGINCFVNGRQTHKTEIIAVPREPGDLVRAEVRLTPDRSVETGQPVLGDVGCVQSIPVRADVQPGLQRTEKVRHASTNSMDSMIQHEGVEWL
eukprot:scaffold166158_cov41-Prasinocladus_malaysianus.AAC.1